ncbi:uncharacterized protein LOC122511374 [Leptopilina heterotoma]|uniref:uncharacterized protein LOC122511374 n=1 Tax=Leptopilina heterotoma TaxID=63436 RepID=UPI001CA82660|nr:uncharacterized protein LOC122511374 [Leptopilina heterotoma]
MEKKFKIALLLTLTCTSARSLNEKNTKEELLESAAAQLERLQPFRNARKFSTNDLDASRNNFFYHSNKTRNRDKEKGSNEKLDEYRFPLQLLQILGSNNNNNNNNGMKEPSGFQLDKRNVVLDANPNSLQDANFDLFQEERIKRSGSNSGSFISGIASKVIGGIAGASSGLSKGSSSSSDSSHTHGTTAYGPPVYSYEHQSFNAWDFKKAILNTVFQAIKAIGGGVLALKGQLIKGGGFLISTKGRLISSTGEAISNLGRNIASSTYVVAPKPVYTQSGYAYSPPSGQTFSHEESYEGSPPSSHDYSSAAFEDSYHPQNNFGAASDDDVQAGLVIMSPNHHQDDLSTDLDPRHPNIEALEESFGGGSPTSSILSSNKPEIFYSLPQHDLQLPTTKPHLPFVSKDQKNSLKQSSTLQNSVFHVEVPKIDPLPISPTNPSNSLHIDYPPNNAAIAQDSNQQKKKQIFNLASILQSAAKLKSVNKFPGTTEMDFLKLPTFNQIIMKDGGFSFDHPQYHQGPHQQFVNDIKEPIVSGLPISIGHQESLKIPILGELPKEPRYHEYQNIGNGPFPLEMFETFDNTKQYGDDVFGGKLISQSLEVQPAVGYSLNDAGLHRI